jgi:hypothetical protein
MLKYLSAAAVAFAMFIAPMSIPAYAEPAKEQSDAQKKAAENRKQCSKEWADAKTAGKVKNGVMVDTKQKWPQFNGACMKRLSGTT